jgi:triacylglycerol lipase
VFIVSPDVPTDHIIVLCHGFLGFENVGPAQYFNGIRDALVASGCKVITPRVLPTSDIKTRALNLKEAISDLLRYDIDKEAPAKPKVHLIGKPPFFSLGG